ncbi:MULTISPECIES: hypothetical protein [unclassified Clostridioides]|uniref:hypothetical protein n=1 Tax=unclassified Clostridioides TaxID=2635829 RepID=UPI001D0FADEE|nr:hypothetical protein [Clostridioides sp. ES-S-0171-01]MCC0689290.1 hypothetical protein [Clostridioides sp. ES-S-0056-01]MCC0715178.1 hypothetical protein [Clostridioides sp. ES-S-0077-01]UDN54877.1 hypothetical protein JJC02_01370 [Clostridioides sp. ES-S-0054-01]
MDNFLQGVLERLSVSLIVCLVSNLLKKRKKTLKEPTELYPLFYTVKTCKSSYKVLVSIISTFFIILI